MSGQYTPGPWMTWAQDYGCDIYESKGNSTRGDLVAQVPTDDKKWVANARLIAAAPELVEALRGLYALMPEGHTDDTRGVWADARTALVKAGVTA